MTIFNGPLETGVRSLAILAASYPRELDLQRLVDCDYLAVHSGDVDGPPSLHPALPLRSGELLVRRHLVEAGLHLMLSRGLLHRQVDADGITYRATDMASAFLAGVSSPYLVALKERAQWVADHFAGAPDEVLRSVTRRFFEYWSTQFISTGSSSVIVE
jgi:hypothetical protein